MLWYKCWRWPRSPLCSGHPATSPGCGAGRSWRSCWLWWALGPAAEKWWSASPWTAACSPWRWQRAFGVGGRWTPGGISSGNCSCLCLVLALYVCRLERKREGGEESVQCEDRHQKAIHWKHWQSQTRRCKPLSFIVLYLRLSIPSLPSPSQVMDGICLLLGEGREERQGWATQSSPEPSVVVFLF